MASRSNAAEAARTATQEAMAHLGGRGVGLAIVFASSTLDLEQVVRAVREQTGGAPLIGCSSAAEFSNGAAGVGGVSVTVISSDGMEVRTGVGRRYGVDLAAAAEAATAGFAARTHQEVRPRWKGRTLLLFVDGLVGHAEELIEELISHTGPHYQLFGAVAADQLEFRKTFVLHGDEVVSDAFVCAEILSEKPVAIAFGHGWRPATPPLRVTLAQGPVVQEINGQPAWEIYLQHARDLGLEIEAGQESTFLMSHILGMEDGDGLKLRVPLFLNPDGSIHCAAEVLEGAVVHIMALDRDAMALGGDSAVARARSAIGPGVAGALVAECAATRVLLGERFAEEISATASAVAPGQSAGCASYGQLAKFQSEFSGLMSATSLICLFPD